MGFSFVRPVKLYVWIKEECADKPNMEHYENILLRDKKGENERNLLTE